MSVLSQVFLFLTIFAVISYKTVICQTTENTVDSNESEENSTESLNDTDVIPQDLYVIKTVVYEVGILTNASNDTDNSSETHEQVDLSFFDPSSNGSVIDLSNIPVPIQTNVSGLTVTGLLPGVNLATILLPPSAHPVPVLPTKQIILAQNISTNDPKEGAEIVSNLSKILGLTKGKEAETATESEKKSSDKTEDGDELVFELE